MKLYDLARTIGPAFVLFAATACQHEAHIEHHHPAHVEKTEGSEFSRVTLSEKAVERIDLKTTEVVERDASGRLVKVVPYSSLLYGPSGKTWVYTSPKPRTFVRAPVEAERIDGDHVLLAEGPPTGTLVVSVGAVELYGTEFKIGH